MKPNQQNINKAARIQDMQFQNQANRNRNSYQQVREQRDASSNTNRKSKSKSKNTKSSRSVSRNRSASRKSEKKLRQESRPKIKSKNKINHNHTQLFEWSEDNGGQSFSLKQNERIHNNSMLIKQTQNKENDRQITGGKFQIKLVEKRHNSTAGSAYKSTNSSFKNEDTDSISFKQMQRAQKENVYPLRHHKRESFDYSIQPSYNQRQRVIQNQDLQRKRADRQAAQSNKSSQSRSKSRSSKYMSNGKSGSKSQSQSHSKKRKSQKKLKMRQADKKQHNSQVQSGESTPISQHHKSKMRKKQRKQIADNKNDDDDYASTQNSFYSRSNASKMEHAPIHSNQYDSQIRVAHKFEKQTQDGRSPNLSPVQSTHFISTGHNFSQAQQNSRECTLNPLSTTKSPSFTKTNDTSSYSKSSKLNQEQEQPFSDIQKQLSRYKQKSYDFKFQIDSLTRRLHEQEDIAHSWKIKFEAEQEKTDEFFTKAEKYKLLTKDFRRENQQLRDQMEEKINHFSQEASNYETLIRLKEEQEERSSRQRQIIISQLVEQLQYMEQVVVLGRGGENEYQNLGDTFKALFLMAQHLESIDHHNFNKSEALTQSVISYNHRQSQNTSQQTLGQEGNNPNNFSQYMAYGSEGKEKFKISQDQIMFNGESLSQEEHNYSRMDHDQSQVNHSQDTSKIQFRDHIANQFNQSKSPYKSSTQTQSLNGYQQEQNQHQQISMLNSYSGDNNQQHFNQSNQTGDFYQNSQPQRSNQIFSAQQNTISQSSNFQSPMSQEILSKLMQEMISIREQQSHLQDENSLLREQNQRLVGMLDSQRQRNEQSLLPQYKEAFEKLRQANEAMQGQIFKMEAEKSTNVNSQANLPNLESQKESLKSQEIEKIRQDLKDLQGQVKQISSENVSLKFERENFVSQIQSLENFNKKQEKMLNYFQLLNSSSSGNTISQRNGYQTKNQPHLRIHENYEVQNLSPSSVNENVAISKQSILNSNSTNQLKQNMNRILQHDSTAQQDKSLGMSEFSKSPLSGQMNQTQTNRTLQQYNQTHNQETQNQVQAFTLNNVTQSDFNLTQSFLNKSNQSKLRQPLIRGAPLTMNQFLPNATDSSMYVDTNDNDKSEIIVIEGANENGLFSLSSTQPENQMRLSSPINYIQKQIDFNLSNPHIQNSGVQMHQLNTGNFKQSTMKEKINSNQNSNTNSHANLQINHYFRVSDQNISKVQPDSNIMPQSVQNKLTRSPIDHLRLQEIIQTQSQEVTNRDKSGGRSMGAVTNTNGMNISSTIQKSGSDLSTSQLPCVQQLTSNRLLQSSYMVPLGLNINSFNGNGSQFSVSAKSGASNLPLQTSSLIASGNLIESRVNDLRREKEFKTQSTNRQNNGQDGSSSRVGPFSQAQQERDAIANAQVYRLQMLSHNEASLRSNQSSTDRSLEQHLQQNRFSIHQASKNQSQETFQMKTNNGSISSSYAPLRLANNSNSNSLRLNPNKENAIMIEDDSIFVQNPYGNHQHHLSAQSRIISSKIKSPAFYESNHDSAAQTISQHNQTDQIENQDPASSYDQRRAIFNQQMVLDGLIGKINAQGGQIDSYCTTDKQNTLTSGFLTGFTSSAGVVVISNQQSENTEGFKNAIESSQRRNSLNQPTQQIRVNQSSASNYVSEKTMNLQKEITSLDEEIMKLQSNLQQALEKKTQPVDESSLD